MKFKLLKTEEEYDAAIQEVEALMKADPKPGTTKAERLELLTLLVSHYEDAHYPIYPPDPIEAIEFRMDQMGLTRKDLELYIGPRSKVSEILNHKRRLSLSMIRKLHDGLNIPADLLIGTTAGSRRKPRRMSSSISASAPRPSTGAGPTRFHSREILVDLV